MPKPSRKLTILPRWTPVSARYINEGYSQERTERLRVAGGHLYRTAITHGGRTAVALAFVPGVK